MKSLEFVNLRHAAQDLKRPTRFRYGRYSFCIAIHGNEQLVLNSTSFDFGQAPRVGRDNRLLTLRGIAPTLGYSTVLRRFSHD